MSKVIGVVASLCFGCKTCELACSFFNARVFSPAKSFIRIDEHEKEGRFEIRFSSECRLCGSCARSCPNEALIEVKV